MFRRGLISWETAREKWMIFPDGFTGFRGPKELPHPAIDLSIFKSVCHAAARILNGKVAGFEFADITPNFHRAGLEWGYEPSRVDVICNRGFYIVAFCRPRRGPSIVNEYVDAPDLAAALARVSDWQILSKAEVESVVDDAAVKSMSEADRWVVESARRKSWFWFGPTRTVGDLLFHWSD
jgi:hypothetical protein